MIPSLMGTGSDGILSDYLLDVDMSMMIITGCSPPLISCSLIQDGQDLEKSWVLPHQTPPKAQAKD